LQGPKAPLVGLKSIFEPRFVANFRFFKDSAAVINEGYSRASSFAHDCMACTLTPAVFETGVQVRQKRCRYGGATGLYGRGNQSATYSNSQPDRRSRSQSTWVLHKDEPYSSQQSSLSDDSDENDTNVRVIDRTNGRRSQICYRESFPEKRRMDHDQALSYNIGPCSTDKCSSLRRFAVMPHRQVA